MEGAPKRQVNAEEMLAELKQALESSTRAPNAPLPSVSTAPKSSSPRREPRRSQIDRESDHPVKAKTDSSAEPRTDPQRWARPSSRRRMLAAGGLALAVAATIGVSFALMNKALDLPERESSVAATEGLVMPQNAQTLKPSSDSRSLTEDRHQSAPLNTRPEASIASANNGSVPVGKGEVDTPNLASSGLETTAPVFSPPPLNSAPVLVPTQRIGPDGAPITKAPSPPVPTVSAPPLAETPKPAAAPAASQGVKPEGTAIPKPPPTPSPTASASLIETPNQAATPAASQSLKPDGAAIAKTPSTPAPAASASLSETPKPNGKPMSHASNESTQPSTPKIDSKKKPLEKASLQKPLGSPKPPVRPIVQAERQATEPAQPKEAERSPQPPQGAGNPAQVAPVAAPSVQQRVADGMTHAFGYLVHLPGALVPHFGGSNPDAH
jgi:hypothetical protein